MKRDGKLVSLFGAIGVLCALVFVLATITHASGNQFLAANKRYRQGAVDDYHGTEVADPYRWLEDLNAPETRAWVEEQNTSPTFKLFLPFSRSARI